MVREAMRTYPWNNAWTGRENPKALALLFLGNAEIGLENYTQAIRHFSAVEEMTKEKFYLYWYWRLGQLGMSRAWLAAENFTNALHGVDPFMESALSTDDPTLQALAWEMKARMSLPWESGPTPSRLCPIFLQSCRDSTSQSQHGKCMPQRGTFAGN